MFRFYKILSWAGGTYIDVGGLVTYERMRELLDYEPLMVNHPHGGGFLSEYVIYEG